jgi:hypothetical protein
LQVIRAKGYSATTIDDICLAAGLTKGSFFHHFKSQGQLLPSLQVQGRTLAAGAFRGDGGWPVRTGSLSRFAYTQAAIASASRADLFWLGI